LRRSVDMKLVSARLLLVAILLGTMVGESAQARSSRGGHDGKSAQSGKSDDGGKKGRRSHRHARPGIVAVTPVWILFPPWGYSHYTPEWSEPVVYIERDSGAARPAEYWYYCPDAQEFHPEVKDCPGGWQELVSQPPPAP